MMAEVKKEIKPEEIVLNTEKVAEIVDKENRGLPLKRNEHIWFENKKGVRKGDMAFAMTDEEVNEYAKCKLSVHYFAQNYCKIKREDGTIGKMDIREYQERIIDLYTKNRFSILMASRQTGKEMPYSSKVYTQYGEKLFGDLRIGDKIYNENRELTTVVDIFEQGEKDVYEITLADDRKIRCGLEHLWQVYFYHSRKNKIVNTEYILSNPLFKIRQNGLTKGKKEFLYFIETSKGVEFKEKDYYINPYLMGVLIGDGGLTSGANITICNNELINYLTFQDNYFLKESSIKYQYSIQYVNR